MKKNMKKSVEILFACAMVCAVFTGAMSVVLYLKGLMLSGGQFSIMTLVLLLLSVYTYLESTKI